MTFRKVACLITTMAAGTSGAAHADSFQNLVDKTFQAAPAFAVGAAMAVGDEAPRTYTLGPISTSVDAPVARDAPWHIGSITKSFTATLVLQMVDAGTLSLDTPIGTYVPEETDMHADWQKLTLKQLLSHTAGVPANASKSAFKLRSTTGLHDVRRQVLQDLWTAPITAGQGSYDYSNVGYVLAGFVLETTTGKSWERLVKDRIAAPLGLTSLGYGAPTAEGAAWGHRKSWFRNIPVAANGKSSDNSPWMGPAGTIHLSLYDLARWGQVHLSACKGNIPDFLSAESCALMQKPISDNYGLGWVIDDSASGPRVWHNGSNSMWYANLTFRPRDGHVFVAITNVFHAERIENLQGALQAAYAE